ncbi:MAG: protein kinase [Polyangiaceae bacterium]|nr:protein kinase [Polyangiaceae bacterium]
MDDTLILFGSRSPPAVVAELRECPQCGRAFSRGTFFCPFDGVRLSEDSRGKVLPDRLALVGSTIDDRYEIVSVLGEGATGTCFLVRHAVLGRLLVLKALRAELAKESELSDRFTRVARAVAAVAHPAVVQITDFGNLSSGEPYFVMEYVAGVSLSCLLSVERRLAPSRALRIARQLANGLAAAHAQGITHHALKPADVMVGPRDEIKILDLGLSRIASASQQQSAEVVFGAPNYLSPEQVTGGGLDHRVDIYALGVLTHQMLAGEVPFDADTYRGVITQLLFSVPPRPSTLAELGELAELEAITLRCLEKDREGRYATMADLAMDLERLSPPVATERARAPTPELSRRGSPDRPPWGPTVQSPRRLLDGPRFGAMAFAIVGALVAAGTLVAMFTLRGRGVGADEEVRPPPSPEPLTDPDTDREARDRRTSTGESAPVGVGRLAEETMGPGATGGTVTGPAATGPGATVESRSLPSAMASASGPERAPAAPRRPNRPGVGEIVDPWEN